MRHDPDLPAPFTIGTGAIRVPQGSSRLRPGDPGGKQCPIAHQGPVAGGPPAPRPRVAEAAPDRERTLTYHRQTVRQQTDEHHPQRTLKGLSPSEYAYNAMTAALDLLS